MKIYLSSYMSDEEDDQNEEEEKKEEEDGLEEVSEEEEEEEEESEDEFADADGIAQQYDFRCRILHVRCSSCREHLSALHCARQLCSIHSPLGTCAEREEL